MKLHQAVAAGTNTFTGYGVDYFTVNGARHDRSAIVLPDRILEWEVAGFESLRAEDFQVFETLGADIVLLGTGAKQRFPHPRLTATLARAGIGVEVMDLQAACRTYNILVAEERKVAAALLFG
ncbi:MAG TPA: Mth938-like domain-containing protein [Burkholderiales bacterium]|nr:Mth938-like domain-containing protein [Burkholderiales bacterium]